MNPVRPEELSALLDGELSSQREREVSAALVADPQLNAQFEALSRLDARWREAGAAARFVPVASMPTPRATNAGALIAAALVFLLLPIRLVPKLIELSDLAWALNAVALVVVICVALSLLRKDPDEESNAAV